MATRKKKEVAPIGEPLELTDNVITKTIDIDTSYEALVQDPVQAKNHVANQANQLMTFPKPRFEKLLPIVSTILMSVTTGALVLAVGVMLGAGI